MTIAFTLVAACCLAAPAPGPRAAAAENQEQEFLHALQDRGYGDVAVDYLKVLQQRPGMPAALRETWDLEMYRSLKAAANEAFNAEDYDALLAESQQHLARFLKEKPEHPEAVAASAAWGNFSLDRGLKYLRMARTAANKEQKARLLGDARNALEEARGRFQQGAEKFPSRLAAPSPLTKRPSKKDERSVADREDYEADLLGARFQLALVDYYVAQTYSDPHDEARKSVLQKAAATFDAIFQTNRLSGIGLLSHMWHGKTVEELGDTETALDIYDEVLANAPEPSQVQKNSSLDCLFAQVELFRLQILAKQSTKEFLSEATQWLQAYHKLKEAEGYQGILLEVVKAQLAQAKVASGSEKNKLTMSAMSMLGEMVKVRSQYQQEAIQLRHEYSRLEGAEPGTFDEAVAMGDAAAAAAQWANAAAQYARALQLARGKTVERAPAVREALANAVFMQARDQFHQGKLEQCLTTAGSVVRDYKDTPAAPVASSLAVTAAFGLYALAAEKAKPAALERLVKIANFTVANWPAKPEADDARMTLGQVSLVQDKIDEALAVFEKVDRRSDRYATALELAGQTYWRRYLTEKAKPPSEQNRQQMAADREKAVRRLTDSLQAQRAGTGRGRLPPRQAAETQWLLAEIALEGNQPDQAAALLQPLIDAMKLVRPEQVDTVALRIFLAAARLYGTLGDPEKAAGAALILADAGPDTAEVDAVLVQFVKVLNSQRKQAEAGFTEAAAANDVKKAEAAQAELKTVNQCLEKLLANLAARQQFSADAMVYLADISAAIGLGDAAREQYLKIAARAEQDPQFAKTAQQALLRVRAQLVGLLSKEGKYEEALKQVKQLVAAAPNALEPQMQQARILQAWCQRDPSHYQEAVAQWTKIHDLLLPSPKKPPEYHEATYQLAVCLCAQAEKIRDKAAAAEKAKRAEQLLKSTMVLSPNLSGPDMVAKYKALLPKARALQARPTAGEKKP